MLNAFDNLSHQEILNHLDQAIAYHELQDHLHFRKIRNFNGVGYKTFVPNPKQLEFFATGKVAVERALMAANKFGKSLCIALENSGHLTLFYPDWWNGYEYDHAIVSWAAGVDHKSTNGSLKRYYFGDRNGPGLIHPSLIVGEDKQNNTYYIRNKKDEVSSLTFKSHDQGEDTFQAANVNTIHMDEQYPYAIHAECRTRITKISDDFHGMVMASFSPVKGTTLLTMHFTQSEDIETGIVRNVAPGEVHNSTVYINATHDDALHLSEEEKKALYLSYKPEEREARTKGIPSIGSGLIYPLREEEYVVSPFSIPEYWPRCFGLDFGWHHPTAAVFLARDPDNLVVYAYAEYAASHLTPQHHAYELIQQGADWMPGAYDHSGNSPNQVDGSNVVDHYIASGISNLIKADKKSVSDGIFSVLQAMENGKFKVFSTLNKLLTEIRMYSRDEKGRIKKGNDDLMDAMRYAFVTGLPNAVTRLHYNASHGMGGYGLQPSYV